MPEIISQLETEIQELFDGESSGHDIYHLRRTLNLALTLQEKEGGDKLIIAVAAFLHDVHRIIQKQTGEYCSPEASLPKVKEILDTTDLSESQKDNILHCIKYHEELDFAGEGTTVDDIEALIIQDADNLDAIGAIGIGRVFSYGGAHGLPMWVPEDPSVEEVFTEGAHDTSSIHHFHRKLLKLKDNMNTKTAQQMAAARHDFMQQFLQEFTSEWAGEK